MLEESGNFVYVNPDRGQMIPSSRVLVAREASKEPLVISMTNGDNEDAVKKIVLDPDNGIVVTQDKTRKKRSTAEDETESTTVKSQDHEATEDGNYFEIDDFEI